MEERRKDPRYKVRTNIKYKKAEAADWHSEPFVGNISLGGLFFESYEKFSLGDRLIFKLQIFREGEDSEIIDLEGEVVAVEDGIVNHGTRVKFTGLTGYTKTRLKEFMTYLKF